MKEKRKFLKKNRKKFEHLFSQKAKFFPVCLNNAIVQKAEYENFF